MPTEIIDLDELVSPPKKVRIQGNVYTLPSELPVELYLRLRVAEQAYAEAQENGEEVDENQRVEELHDLLLELFREHQPDLEKLPGGLIQLFTIIPRVYGAASVVEEEDEPDPNSSTHGRGKPSTKPRTRSKSRS